MFSPGLYNDYCTVFRLKYGIYNFMCNYNFKTEAHLKYRSNQSINYGTPQVILESIKHYGLINIL